MLSSRVSIACLALTLAGCAPQTGLYLEVLGPTNKSSVDAGIAELRLIAAHQSYCERWITDGDASMLRFSVAGRDLGLDPVTILITPDKQTGGIQNYNSETPDPIRPIVLALDASGKLLGVASFDPHPFFYEEVRKYSEHITLYTRNDGPAYLAADGCLCAPGVPSVATSSGSGCDLQVPSSYARLVDTAGCELPPGGTIPLDACDGQLYPGEKQNRELPCFVAAAGACRIGQRICNDRSGRTYDRECTASSMSPSLSTSALCDAYLGCEANACRDPGACMRSSAAVPHKTLTCTLPVSPMAKDGESVACDGGSWSLAIPSGNTTSCVATMLDGTAQGPVTLGFGKAGTPDPQLIASTCPATLVVGNVDGDPATLPPELAFSFSIEGTIYDVSLKIDVGCVGASDSPLRSLRCKGL